MESSSNKPSWQDISAYSPTTKQYWALWNSLISGMVFLYRKLNQRWKDIQVALVLPRSRIPEVLKEIAWQPNRRSFRRQRKLCTEFGERFCWGKCSTGYRDINLFNSFRSGRNFVSAVLKGVCELHGIDKTKTTPLHPQSDGMVERGLIVPSSE
ncbi:retrovirus-related Pol polyprotein from transposon 412 [Trichonephila clavipes]|nr:retrovirus-related Pol polyprotein from transposon 412 [Trichonephila clavipes]